MTREQYNSLAKGDKLMMPSGKVREVTKVGRKYVEFQNLMRPWAFTWKSYDEMKNWTINHKAQ